MIAIQTHDKAPSPSAIKTKTMVSYSLLALALSLFGCNEGDRDPGDGDNETESRSEEDSDPILDTETNRAQDSDSTAQEPGEDFRDIDAGDTWDDGTITIDEPCENHCQYVYGLEHARWNAGGGSRFEIQAMDNSTVRAYGLDSVSFVHYVNFDSYWGHVYKQKTLSDFTLKTDTLEFVEGRAHIQTSYLETRTAKIFHFAYNSQTKEFTYSLQVNGRRWTRTLKSDEAPLIMFNHKQYPNETWGLHSSLFSYLIGQRYDFARGGVQKVTVFSPDVERVDTINVEVDQENPDTLIVHLPTDGWRPLKSTYSSSLGNMTADTISISYIWDIPTRYTTLYEYNWQVLSAPPFETNLTETEESSEVFSPNLPESFTLSPIQIQSGPIEIAGEIAVPQAAGPHPVVILVPGWEPITRKGEEGAVDVYKQMAAHLAASGYLVLSTDARGSGNSLGDLKKATVSELAGDVKSMIDSLSAVSEADVSKVFLLARKNGIHIAAKAARDANTAVRGLILLAPSARSYKQWAAENYAYYLQNGGFTNGLDSGTEDIKNMTIEFNTLLDSLAANTYSGHSWRGHTPESWQSIFNLDLVENPAGLPPALILVPTEDHLVMPEEGHALFNAMQDADVASSLEELEGLTHALTRGTARGLWPEHGAMEEVDEAAIDAIVHWLDAEVGGAR